MKFIFKTSTASFIAFFFLCILSIVCMKYDASSSKFHNVREKASIVALPVQGLVHFPLYAVHWLGSAVSSRETLLEENERLRQNQLVLEASLQKFLSIQRENNQLKEVLSAAKNVQDRAKVARLLAIDLDPSLNQMILNQGSSSKVYIGQPVFDAYGVMGQVIQYSYVTSKVLLITDPRFAIPVKDSRSGVRAIAVGQGAGKPLKLINLLNTADVNKDDVFISSGLGMVFPEGYPVGTVLSNMKSSDVLLQISARMSQTDQVLLVWPGQKKMTGDIQAELKKSVVTNV